MSKSLLFIVLFINLFFISCQTENHKKDTWFAGKIDNPVQDYVLLKQNRTLIDTILLDNKNFFRYKFNDSIKEGMYTFIHDNTYSFYIAPGDSLLMIANTLDFDTSLFYSNDHAAENNFIQLLSKRLKYDNFYWSELHEYTTKEFDDKLGKREKESKKLFQKFQKNNPNASKRYLRIIEGTIDQDRLLNRERYIQAHFSNDYGIDKNIPKSFYEHRKEISFSQDALEVFFPYYNLLNTYLDNLVLDSFESKELFSRSDFEHNKYKLELINTMATDKEIRNQLLYTTTRNFLLYTKSAQDEKDLQSLHNELSTCPESKQLLAELSNYTSKLKSGNKVPEISLLTLDNTEVDLASIITKPSLIFFWSYKSIQHQKNIHTRVKELQSKFPEYQYIGINLDDHFKTWRSEINKLGYSKDSEFQLYDPKQGKKDLVIKAKNKILILDAKANILNGNSNIFHHNIENELLEFLNM